MEDDKDGKSFYFEVNGQPMFAKGANFIPDDALLPNVTEERYYQLMKEKKLSKIMQLLLFRNNIDK